MSGKRTPEQQKEYNRLRREENARRKAEADAQVAAIKAERAAAKKAKAAKPEPKKFAGKTATAKHIKGVDAPVKGDRHDEIEKIKAKAKPIAEALSTISPQNGAPNAMTENTLVRSRRRVFRGNGATKRGDMNQITVTFNDDQFAVLTSRAAFYNASLAETVRRCVMAGPLPESR